MATNPLAKELAKFDELLPSLLKDEGKFVVIFGDQVVGIFDTYNDALKAGYAKAKLVPFLVKRISGTESVSYFTRDIDEVCRISQS